MCVAAYLMGGVIVMDAKCMETERHIIRITARLSELSSIIYRFFKLILGHYSGRASEADYKHPPAKWTGKGRAAIQRLRPPRGAGGRPGPRQGASVGSAGLFCIVKRY